jgi:hypothetical protein
MTVGPNMHHRKNAWIFETKADVYPEVFLQGRWGGADPDTEFNLCLIFKITL